MCRRLRRRLCLAIQAREFYFFTVTQRDQSILLSILMPPFGLLEMLPFSHWTGAALLLLLENLLPLARRQTLRPGSLTRWSSGGYHKGLNDSFALGTGVCSVHRAIK